MATLHFFGGEKGGTGKSLVARTAAQYHLDRGIDFSLFDADRSNPDVQQTYHSIGCGSVIFSENRKHQDEPHCLYFEAQKKTTLVNLPPQVGIPLRDWLDLSILVNRGEEDRVGITYWFVCNGEPASVRILDEHLSKFQGSINHVLVKNMMYSDNSEYLDENQSLQQKIKDYKVNVLDFPRFMGRRCLDEIIARGLTFGEAREDEGIASLDRHRINNFLKGSYKKFEEIAVFDGEANQGGEVA